MRNESLQRIKERLMRYKAVKNLADVLTRTPAHAIHWYIVMVIALLVTIGNVAAAWLVFHTISSDVAAVFDQEVIATTIKREDLRKVLDTYQARLVELENVKAAPPRIIDPGR